MGRGLIGGVIVGGLVSAVVLVLAGVAIDRVTLADLGMPEPQAPVADTDSTAPDTTAEEGDPAEATEADTDAPTVSDDATAEDEDGTDTTDPAAMPDTGVEQDPAAQTTTTAPEGADPLIVPETDTAPAAENPPVLETAPTPEPAPAPDAEPVVTEPQSDADEAAPESPADEPQAVDDAAAQVDAATEEAPEGDEAPTAAPLATVVAPGVEDTGETALVVDNVVVEAPEPDVAAEPGPPSSVVTGRLPTIGEDSEEAPSDAPATGALDRNAADYVKAEGMPEMSVILIDSGSDRASVGDLAMMPFPLSVAVDASAVDAQEAIDFYRAAGAEVILLIPLPPGATPTDVDVTFQVYEPLLDQVVAIMFDPEAGFQTLGDGAAQVATVAQEYGLGLVSFPEGLNTGHKSAVSVGVPAALVFRDLDGAGQAPDVIRRFLDNVAFRARNENGVLAVARVKADTLQALLEWSLGSRAQSVNFAPVSAVLPR